MYELFVALVSQSVSKGRTFGAPDTLKDESRRIRARIPGIRRRLAVQVPKSKCHASGKVKEMAAFP
jgi:hypothetical protein